MCCNSDTPTPCVPVATPQPAVTPCGACDYWNQDHTTEVNCNDDKYLDSSQLDVTPVKYRFEGNLAAGNIQITLIFQLGNLDSALTPDQITRVKNDFRSV